ncbi:hypothetical protein J6590_026015 [Homalodisca vitripennis]|nr:hypothetical protein J6590_026015 [Homalodisca vitripennis]
MVRPNLWFDRIQHRFSDTLKIGVRLSKKRRKDMLNSKISRNNFLFEREGKPLPDTQGISFVLRGVTPSFSHDPASYILINHCCYQDQSGTASNAPRADPLAVLTMRSKRIRSSVCSSEVGFLENETMEMNAIKDIFWVYRYRSSHREMKSTVLENWE